MCYGDLKALWDDKTRGEWQDVSFPVNFYVCIVILLLYYKTMTNTINDIDGMVPYFHQRGALHDKCTHSTGPILSCQTGKSGLSNLKL